MEAAYDVLRASHGELPAVVVTTRSGRSARQLLLGQACHGQWANRDGGSVSELFISGECVAAGGAFVWNVIVHEAAHLLGAARGVANTSGQGNRYHNAAFRKLAEELGAWYPLTEAHPTRGYCDTELTASTLEDHRDDIAALDAALSVSIPSAGPARRRGGGDRNNMRFTCECEPPRIMRMSPRTWELDPPWCRLCDAEFA